MKEGLWSFNALYNWVYLQGRLGGFIFIINYLAQVYFRWNFLISFLFSVDPIHRVICSKSPDRVITQSISVPITEISNNGSNCPHLQNHRHLDSWNCINFDNKMIFSLKRLSFILQVQWNLWVAVDRPPVCKLWTFIRVEEPGCCINPQLRILKHDFLTVQLKTNSLNCSNIILHFQAHQSNRV